jgi:hypothetical protein
VQVKELEYAILSAYHLLMFITFFFFLENRVRVKIIQVVLLQKHQMPQDLLMREITHPPLDLLMKEESYLPLDLIVKKDLVHELSNSSMGYVNQSINRRYMSSDILHKRTCNKNLPI